VPQFPNSVYEENVSSLDSIGSQSDSAQEIEFWWRDSTGATHSIREYKGTTVLLNFWATWCAPCREELPALRDIAANSNDTVIVIGVSTDRTLNTLQMVRSFIDSQNIKYQIILDTSTALFVDYLTAYSGMEGIPETYIIGKDGTVKFVLVGSQSEQTFKNYIAKAN
jgi:cytochrome c-type biogenesis protein